MPPQSASQPEIEQVQHPILGALKFPKDMPYDQRNQIISGMEAERNLTGPDDPNGNYDFGDIGKVKGARMNGRPATRQEALSQLTGQRGIAQTIGNTLQQQQQAMSNFGQSVFNPDQQTKAYMGDLAQMAALGGASKLANAGRSSGSVLPTVQRIAGKAARPSVDQLLNNAVGAIDKKYPITPGALAASRAEAPPPSQDIVDLLQRSIAATNAK